MLAGVDGEARRIYAPGDVAGRLGISGQRVRQLAAVYERVHGPLPRDRRGRVWPEEAVERLEGAHAAVGGGRAASVEQALRAPESAAEGATGAGPNQAPGRGTRGDTEALGALVSEMQLLRGAVEGMSRRMASLERDNRELREAVGAGRELEASRDQSTEQPARASGFSAVAREALPIRHYILGLFFVWVFTTLDFALNDLSAYIFGTMAPRADMLRAGPDLLANVVSLRALAPLAFGFYVGFWRYDPVRWKFAGLGLLVGLGSGIAVLGVAVLAFGFPPPFDAIVDLTATYLWGPFFLFMSGLLLGNALQRGILAAPAAPKTTPSAVVEQFSPKQQALWTIVGTVIAALIAVIPDLVSLITNGGGNGN